MKVEQAIQNKQKQFRKIWHTKITNLSVYYPVVNKNTVNIYKWQK